MKRVSSCLAGGEGLLGSELLQFCQNAAHEHAVGEGEAVARARRRQRVVDEEAAALGIANRIQAIDDLVLGAEHFEINGGFEAAKGHQDVAVRDGGCEERSLFNREESVGALADLDLCVAQGFLILACRLLIQKDLIKKQCRR